MALDEADIPADAPQDAVMAGAEEVAAMAQWAAEAFRGTKPAPDGSRIALELRRQDHAVLRFGRSALDGPIQIGARKFARGLGTHASSEIVASAPAGARSFHAEVGVDNGIDPAGKRGTVRFIVEVGGKEAARTAVLSGGDEPVAVHVDLPADARQVVLKADATADGTGWDRADWADAHFLLADGRKVWLDEGQRSSLLAAAGPPLSFLYGGKASAELLPKWTRAAEMRDTPAATEHRVQWTDPETKLRLSAVLTVYKRYPAADWVCSIENGGTADTPILEGFQALDVTLGTAKGAVVLHGLAGDNCSERSHQPFAAPLAPGGNHRLAPQGGRSSNGAFPFFNVDCEGQGVIAAIGWSGQWAAALDRDPSGTTRLRAGMERMRLYLRPGERIRTPRILLMAWRGGRQDAHNRFRRLMLFHYVPKDSARPAAMPVFCQGYDRYHGNPRWGNEAGQLHAAKVAKATACEFLWLDADWFPGNFPNGVGNWSCKPKEFPNGLKPVSDACHRMGLKFIVWFEPERVAAGSQIAREHPEFVLGGEKGGLFKLNDPAARKWLTDLLSVRIGEFGMDWYRNDFNIDPLPFWRAADEPDRQGMTEIRYVEGHYEMWDELRKRHPGLHIDNCASGGRRIDLETCMRSVPLWQSDTACAPGRSDWDQAQTLALGLYIPFHQSCAWGHDAYTLRSAAAAGIITQFPFLDEGFPVEQARQAVAEVAANRKYWYGDLYPLTPCTTGPDQFIAWQLHRPDLNAGLVLAFRRQDCGIFGFSARLGGLDPNASYTVEFLDEARQKTTRTMTGKDMAADFPLLIPQRRASLIARYRISAKS